MADYRSWKEKTVGVPSLLLDALNPRMPGNGAGAQTQPDLIAELVRHENVYALAKDIAAGGYVPVESLVGLDEDGKTVVLEGNRRLAALKLLLHPELAPLDSVTKFKALSEKISPSQLAKVRVLYAPSREAAAPLILRKHTREQVERWSVLMQAKFYASLAASGIPLEEMAREYATTAGEIRGFLRTHAMYEAACRIPLPDDVREKVHDPRTFPGALLQRLIEIPKVREFLGIDFDARGGLLGGVHREEFAKGFRRILSDIAREKQDTRSLNTVDDVAQ